MKIYSFIIFIFIGVQANTQTRFEFGYSFGANATTSRTIKSDNMTWGYYTPPYPSTWTNHFSFGWGTLKDRIYFAFDEGGLGPTWKAKGTPDKYPYQDTPPTDGSTDMSVAAHYQGGARFNSNLLKFSLLYKHTWYQKKNFHHKSIFGLGYLKTRVRDGYANSVMSFYDDSLGWVNSGMVMDKYVYFRNQNMYFIFGYEMTYKIKDRWNWNIQVMYNQGLFKMIRWHTYRTYSESLTGYTEFDEQWSFTRLSYFAFLTGISYDIGGYKKKKDSPK